MKPGGLLESIVKAKEPKTGICENCGNLIDIGSEFGYGCEAHDKLILANFPPYYNQNHKCKDWKERKN